MSWSLTPKFWRDITENPPGHTVAKDLFRAQAFYAGLLLCFLKAGAELIGRDMSAEPALFLLAYALGAQGLKAYENYQNRKTADQSGNALAVPGSTEPPAASPELMPQSERHEATDNG